MSRFSKISWLPDSTRIDLLPHSSIRYPHELSWYRRRAELISGSAKIELRTATEGAFRIESGELYVDILKDANIQLIGGQIIILRP
jgi:hypothetical protein